MLVNIQNNKEYVLSINVKTLFQGMEKADSKFEILLSAFI
jgi:hypothetical protein